MISMIQFISVIVILFIQTQMTLTMVEAQYRTTGKEQTNNNNNNNRNNRNKEDRTGKLENVAYVCAGFPWMYGPYQMQGDQLMKELSNKGKYPQYNKMFWMFRGSNAHGIPQGKYTAEEISKLAPPQVPKMPKQWDAKHLTFLGLPKRTKLTEVVARINGAAVSISEINDAAKLYSIDAFIVLGDINVVYHDAYDFNVPTVAWVPFHYNTVRGSNRALLKPYTHVIGLAPSTAKVIKDVRADVSYLPHFIDANVIRKDAKNWLAKERKTLLTQKENKNKTDREIVFDANKYDSMFKRRANDFKAVEENNDEDDVFLVLASGTNYEGADRKGWDIAIQAFAKFHEMYPEIKKHLWVHSFQSTQVMRDHDGNGQQAPPELKPQGVDLRGLVQEMDIPPELYTVDINLHPRGRVAAMKIHANVCLHPSKVEGFGMNVVECQSVGTPVVTTKFRAMDDFTKNGISVPPAQWEHYPSLGGKWAMPDVKGVAKALGVIAKNRKTEEWKKKSIDTVEWIKEEFSLDRIAKGMDKALKQALETHLRNLPNMLSKVKKAPSFTTRPMFHVTTDEYPKMAEWDEEWVLFHRKDVRVNYDKVQTMLHDLSTQEGEMVSLAFIVCKDFRGIPIEMQVREHEYDGIHRFNTEHPILLPTWAFAQAQQNFPYIHNAAWMLAGNSDQQFIKMFPPGAAQVMSASEVKQQEIEGYYYKSEL
jgi:glycosyltransferase involved in cell wall biosynthesis